MGQGIVSGVLTNHREVETWWWLIIIGKFKDSLEKCNNSKDLSGKNGSIFCLVKQVNKKKMYYKLVYVSWNNCWQKCNGNSISCSFNFHHPWLFFPDWHFKKEYNFTHWQYGNLNLVQLTIGTQNKTVWQNLNST